MRKWAQCLNYILCKAKTQTRGAQEANDLVTYIRCHSLEVTQVSLLTLELAKVCQLKLNSNHLNTIAGVIFGTTAGTLDTAVGATGTQVLKHHLQ